MGICTCRGTGCRGTCRIPDRNMFAAGSSANSANYAASEKPEQSPEQPPYAEKSRYGKARGYGASTASYK